uniref:Peptide deformylase n=2 Tax=Latimeria chalumnae TaxID=7897 RepID=H3AJV4_LATCH
TWVLPLVSWLPTVCGPSRSVTLTGCSYSTGAKQRTYWKYLKRKIIRPPSPPFQHVCQVGDPVLRSSASMVDPAKITDPEIQQLIKTLVKVMRKVECVGLSAPQVGVPLQVLVMEFSEQKYNENSPRLREAREMVPFPLKVFVNPKMMVLSSQTVSFPEGCKSIAGFSACVPRYHAVEVTGLNECGETVSWQASGWPARIIQHEMDHLNGVLYIDKMDSKTFVNMHWAELN